jgi:hypothetical protein
VPSPPTATPEPTVSPVAPSTEHSIRPTDKTIGPTPPQNILPPLPDWLFFTLIAGLLGTVTVATLSRRKRGDDRVNSLEITTPRSGSIAIAGRTVTFTAAVNGGEPANHAVWSLTGEPGIAATGATFSTEWTGTGVHQVVASVDGLTCAVIVYVFETPDGTGTIADLMQAKPPLAPRSVESFPQYPTRAVRVAA